MKFPFQRCFALIATFALLSGGLEGCKPKRAPSGAMTQSAENRMAFVVWSLNMRFDADTPNEKNSVCLYYFQNKLEWFANNPGDKQALFAFLAETQPNNLIRVNHRAVDAEALAIEMANIGDAIELVKSARIDPKGDNFLSDRDVIAEKVRLFAADALDQTDVVEPMDCPDPFRIGQVLEASEALDPEGFYTRVFMTDELQSNGEAVPDAPEGPVGEAVLNLLGPGTLVVKACGYLCPKIGRLFSGKFLNNSLKSIGAKIPRFKGGVKAVKELGEEVTPAVARGVGGAAQTTAGGLAKGAATKVGVPSGTARFVRSNRSPNVSYVRIRRTRAGTPETIVQTRTNVDTTLQSAGVARRGVRPAQGQPPPANHFKVGEKYYPTTDPNQMKTFMGSLGPDSTLIAKDPALQADYASILAILGRTPRSGMQSIGRQADLLDPKNQEIYRRFVRKLTATRVIVARSANQAVKVPKAQRVVKLASKSKQPASVPVSTTKINEAADTVVRSAPDPKLNPVQSLLNTVAGAFRRKDPRGTLDLQDIKSNPTRPIATLDRTQPRGRPQPEGRGPLSRIRGIGNTAVSLAVWTIAPSCVLAMFGQGQCLLAAAIPGLPPPPSGDPGQAQAQPGVPEVTLESSDTDPSAEAEAEMADLSTQTMPIEEELTLGLSEAATNSGAGLGFEEILQNGLPEQRQALAREMKNTMGLCYVKAICVASYPNIEDTEKCFQRECNEPDDGSAGGIPPPDDIAIPEAPPAQ
jgi:hypothetical protein